MEVVVLIKGKSKMKFIFFKVFLVFFFFSFWNHSHLFSQETQSHILIEIEDSLRGKLLWENDSAWINSQLIVLSKPFDKNGIKYKLVKIGKRKFTEYPQVLKPFSEPTSIDFSFGDSAYSVIGKKVYTYIGNNSWGYYYEYWLLRVDNILTGDDLWYNQKCNKGHNKGIAKPCELCYEENSEEIEKLILLKIGGS